MVESHTAAVSAVISSLQGFCRGSNPANRQLCRRSVYERMILEEVTRSDDPEYQSWRSDNEKLLQACYDECRLTGKTEVRVCNSRCINPVVQGIWKRTNVSEYESIISQYSD